MAKVRSSTHTSRQRARGATHALRGDIPLPPLPGVSLGLVGADAATEHAIASLSELPVCALPTLESAPPIAALLLDLDGDPTLLAALAARREAGDEIPALAFATGRDFSREALRADAYFVRGPLDADDLAEIAWRSLRYAMSSGPHLSAWAATELVGWISGSLAPCGLTPRRSEIVALAALGRQRAAIAQEMGISLKRVDEQIGTVLEETNQLRLSDVASPFAARVAALGARRPGTRRPGTQRRGHPNGPTLDAT